MESTQKMISATNIWRPVTQLLYTYAISFKKSTVFIKWIHQNFMKVTTDDACPKTRRMFDHLLVQSWSTARWQDQGHELQRVPTSSSCLVRAWLCIHASCICRHRLVRNIRTLSAVVMDIGGYWIPNRNKVRQRTKSNLLILM